MSVEEVLVELAGVVSVLSDVLHDVHDLLLFVLLLLRLLLRRRHLLQVNNYKIHNLIISRFTSFLNHRLHRPRSPVAS